MSSYIESPYYSQWYRYRKVQLYKWALLANVFHIALLVLGFKRFMKILHFFHRQTEIKYTLLSREESILLKRAVNPIFKRIRKSEYIWSSCLSSSMLLWWTLKNQCLETQLIIGVAKKEGNFKAHAWVEHDNFPLNENKKIKKTYQIFDHDFLNNSSLTL